MIEHGETPAQNFAGKEDTPIAKVYKMPWDMERNLTSDPMSSLESSEIHELHLQ